MFDECCLCVHHPEFCQMFTGFGFLRSENRAEIIYPAETGNSGLQIKLTRLRKISIPLIEIRNLEKGSSPFTGIGCQDRRIKAIESVLIEILADSVINTVPDLHQSPLPRGSQPEMPVTE